MKTVFYLLIHMRLFTKHVSKSKLRFYITQDRKLITLRCTQYFMLLFTKHLRYEKFNVNTHLINDIELHSLSYFRAFPNGCA